VPANAWANAFPAPECGAFYDPASRGSKWAQVGTGVVGIILAIVLVVGQVSLATSRGIQAHLVRNVAKLREGNKTMEEIVLKGEPSVHVAKVVQHQQAVLEHTRVTMVGLNQRMTGIVKTTDGLATTVGSMRTASSALASGVASMDASTQKLGDLLGPLPGKADATGAALGQINNDSSAINGELTAISGKMEKYGLPHATGVRGQ
jgi:hypothetical protein